VAVFRPADPPRTGTVAFWSPDESPLPLGVGEHVDLRVVAPVDGGIEQRVVRAVELPVGEAVSVLGRARKTTGAHASVSFWGAVSLVALQLVARGRLLPGVSPAGHDAWRVGPYDQPDVERVLQLAEAMPPEARSVPLPQGFPCRGRRTGTPRLVRNAPGNRSTWW
jgi:hypothetical protein